MYNIGDELKHFFITVTSFVLITVSLHAKEQIAQVANRLGLYAGTKATIQWERVFMSEKKMQLLGIDRLDSQTKEELKNYLKKHAADSQQPMVPGL